MSTVPKISPDTYRRNFHERTQTMTKTHFHANVRDAEGVRSLGSFTTREKATTGLLLVIGQRLASSPGWVTREAYLPVDTIGTVVIENLLERETVSSSVWGCTCREGARDVRGLS